MPLPYLLAFEVPVFTRVPLALVVQVAGPVFAASLAMCASARFLSDREAGLAKAWAEVPKGAACAAAGIAALLAVLLTQILGLISVLLLPGLAGPPLLAQAVGAEKLSLRAALQRLGDVASGRGALYLLNVALGAGLIAMLVLGAFGLGVVDAPDLVRAVVAPLLQAALLGVLVGFLAAFELELFADARSTSGASTPG